MTALEGELRKQREVNKELEMKLVSHNREKDEYLAEFGSLKVQYEGVIQRLEDALLGYQQKNWNLEQENKDLNSQLEALQELLQEVKAMNTMQIHKKEYRKMAELEVAAKRGPGIEVNIQEKRNI